MHSGGLELTKLTYTRLEDNLIRYRGDQYTTPGDINPNPKSNITRGVFVLLFGSIVRQGDLCVFRHLGSGLGSFRTTTKNVRHRDNKR